MGFVNWRDAFRDFSDIDVAYERKNRRHRGILTGLLTPKSRDFAWRLLFVVGMICGGVIGVKLLGHAVPTDFGVSGIVLATAGLLVGVGTRLANGCTSGHGICGIGRFSKRSIVATCVFMVVAAITVFVRLHLM